MATMCNSCSKPLRGSKYYEVICRDATEHEDKEKQIDEMQNKSEENKEKKVNDLATLKAKLHDLEERMKDVDDKELDDLLESVKDQIEELENLKPDEEAKKSKSAMGEFVGVNNFHSAGVDLDTATESLVALQSQRHRQKKLKQSQSYSVLTLKPYESVSGDSLFIKMGSTDSDSVSNTSGDELMRKLGSSD